MNRPDTHGRRLALVLAVLAVVAAGCGSRLSGGALALAEGSSRAGGGATTGVAGTGGSGGGPTTSAPGGNAGGTSAPASSGSTGPASSTPAAAGSGGSASGPATAAATSGGSTAATSAPSSASCDASNNGGATDVGVTANTISIGNIASIGGVAPGLTQTAQQATQAFVAYVNSQGGICGRKLVLSPYDDQSDAGQDYADASQACHKNFALVGSASAFDNGGASAIQSCGIPDVAAELSTPQIAAVPNAFGANPGNAHYWPLGPAIYLKHTYPNAVTHAAMIYLNASTTQSQATKEMNAYTSVGFHYIYVQAVSVTEPNYAPYVAKMQAAGVQYVTEYSDDNSAARLVQAMAQANFTPKVVDFFSEEYSQHFLQESQGDANGDLVLMSTAPYEEAASNPGMQLYLKWLGRVAPGAKHDIFGQFAWSADLAFLQAAKAVGPHLTRAALLAQLRKIGTWDGGGVQPPDVSFGQKIPSKCFSYFKIDGSSGFSRVYPTGANQYDCSGGLFHY